MYRASVGSTSEKKTTTTAAGLDHLAQGIRAMTTFARQDLAGRVAMAWHSSRQNPVFGVFEGCIQADLARRGVSEAQKTCHKTAMSATQCQARKRHSELERLASCAVAEGVRARDGKPSRSRLLARIWPGRSRNRGEGSLNLG